MSTIDDGTVRGPHHHMWDTRLDLVITAGTAIDLGRLGRGDLANQPLAVTTGLGMCPARG
jgi:hypothetical protein